MQAGAHTQDRPGRYSFAFRAISALILLSALAAAWTQSLYWLAAPLAVMFLWVLAMNLRMALLLVFAAIPVSIEYYLPIGLGLDLPDEPLMMLTTFFFTFWYFSRHGQLRKDIWAHPVTLFIALQLAWIGICALFAVEKTIAWKFLIAKSWYLGCFYLAAFYWTQKLSDFQRPIKWFFIVLLPVTAWALFRHGFEYGFSFADVNRALWPLFRNHVSYAALLAVSFPYLVYYVWKRKKEGSSYWWLLGVLVFLFVAINFSYTRAAMGAVILLLPYYFIVKWRLSKWAIVIAVAGVILLMSFLIRDYHYMNMTPRYEKTVTHTRFEDLLDATYKFQDISTMERVYRWVAGFHMVAEKPVFGFGPNNFYHQYKGYTVSAFRTYVSDNPEKSGTHNYYLMLAVDQGIPGLLIYLGMVFFVLIWGERLYHKVKHDPEKSWYVLAALSSLMVIHILQLMNDLIETDKVGPFYFFSLALLVRVHLDLRREKEKTPELPDSL
jgi:O-antigen ligase